MHRILLLTLAMMLPWHLAAAEPIDISVSAVRLNPRDRSERTVGQLEYLGGFELASSDPRWGGFSSMILTTGGDSLLAISDFGNWLRLGLHHDEDGELTGVGTAEMGSLPGPDGKPLSGKGSSDAEGLTVTADGGLLVSFERDPRIWRYDGAAEPFDSPPAAFPTPKAALLLPENSGIEAIASLPDGSVVALSEGSERGQADIAGWLWRDQRWRPIAWSRTPPYRPTDASVLPDGNLLVLERRFNLAGGPGARLSVVAAKDIAVGAHLSGTVLAELAPPQSVDNFEAIAAGPAPSGGVLIYILSDDNASVLQRTLLLQFRWRP